MITLSDNVISTILRLRCRDTEVEPRSMEANGMDTSAAAPLISDFREGANSHN